MMKNYLLFTFLLLGVSLYAQEGIIRGDLYNMETAEPIKNVTVKVVGSTESTKTDLEGKFSLSLSPGTYDLVVEDPLYEVTDIPAVEVTNGNVNYLGEIFVLEKLLSPNGEIELEGITVQARQSNNTETALLTLKKKSTVIMDGISSAKMELTGDGTAVEAAKRVTGVSVEGGKYVYIRGLGDRYSKTTLNGLTIPGLDPDKNTIQMDIFPTSLIDNVMVSKNFTADLPADFTGGIMNIETKAFPNTKFTNISLELGYNPNMHFNSNFIKAKGGKTDFLGFDDGTRALPALANGSQVPTPFQNYSDAQIKDFVNSFSTTLAPVKANSFMDYSVGVSLGDQIDLKRDAEGRSNKIGYIFSLSYKSETNFYDDASYGLSLRSIKPDEYQLMEGIRREGELSEQSVLIGVLGGLAYKTNASKYKLTAMRLQNGVNKGGKFFLQNFPGVGNLSEFKADKYVIEYNQRALTNVSLAGEHVFDGSDWTVDWAISPTFSSSDDPDIRSTSYAYKPNGEKEFNAGAGGYPSRTWRYLDEYNVGAKVDFTKKYQLFKEEARLKFGLRNTYKNRSYEIIQLSLSQATGTQLVPEDPNQVLLPENLYPVGNYYYVSSNSDPNTNEYKANSNNIAAYVSTEFNPLQRLKVILGVRAEKFMMYHTGRDQLLTNVLDNKKVLNSLDFFPSANLIYNITDEQNLRVGFSQTIARPSFKEVSFAQIVDPITGETFNGALNVIVDGSNNVIWDGDLKATHINNFDARWEWFLSRSQMVSLSSFYKMFENPIELVMMENASTPNFQPRNVGNGQVLGLEFEVRKNFDFISNALEDLSLSTNVTWVQSKIDMSETEYKARKAYEKQGENIKKTRDMAGQAPYIINAGLVYSLADANLEAGLFYNVKGPTIAVVGGDGQTPDIITQPYHNVNFSINKRFGDSTLDLKVSNILGEKRESIFESYKSSDMVYERLNPGTTISVGFKHKF